MPRALDLIRAKVLAYQQTLEGKSGAAKSGRVSIQLAQQFNAIVDEIKREFSETATHLPQPIRWTGPAARIAQQADVTFLDLEMLLNQVLAVLDVTGVNQ
jgi:hypothetical protein